MRGIASDLVILLSRQLQSCRTYAVRNQQSEKESDRQNLLTHPAKMVDAVHLTNMNLSVGTY